MSSTGKHSQVLCPQCHRVHRRVAPVLGPSAPDAWLAISKGERLESELTPDVCILADDGRTRHFLRGNLQLPVWDGPPEVFVWAVWAELDLASMEQVARWWSNPNRAAIPPIEGRLANELPYEKPTRGLSLTMHTRDPGQAPLLMVSEPHPLADEQQEGISLHRVAELGALLERT